MKKLSLKLDDLGVQSFATTSPIRDLRCTVRGHMDDDNGGDGGGDYTELCSAIYSCDSCDTCDTCDDLCKEQQRRIILY
jgi:hypothetical protein